MSFIYLINSNYSKNIYKIWNNVNTFWMISFIQKHANEVENSKSEGL